MTVFHTQNLPPDRREGTRQIFREKGRQKLRIKDTWRDRRL